MHMTEIDEQKKEMGFPFPVSAWHWSAQSSHNVKTLEEL